MAYLAFAAFVAVVFGATAVSLHYPLGFVFVLGVLFAGLILCVLNEGQR